MGHLASAHFFFLLYITSKTLRDRRKIWRWRQIIDRKGSDFSSNFSHDIGLLEMDWDFIWVINQLELHREQNC